MTALAAEFFTLDEVNRLKIIQDGKSALMYSLSYPCGWAFDAKRAKNIDRQPAPNGGPTSPM